ncbi:hypothetical protein IL387_06570 [Escherichia coli]|uniref:hypothetical protein n=1 Tax=Escherichia coli TaxID=562 RepID=UPI001934842E|nr:hypothetical protein [Escherichia coli]MBL7379346.1 hypothetical protein [Escherichia coli]
MECNVSELVKRGHDQAAELKSSCGAVDVRDVAQLISDLAAQLDVQLARSNALAAENAGLKSKGRELLTEACSVYEKFNATINSEDGDFIDGQTLHEFQFVLDCETTATDAFMAEVRAQGVEMFAIEWGGHDSPYGQDAYNFADKIRKGVQS